MVDELGTWLAAELKTRSWSMSEMGRQAGYSSTHISDVISGTANPSADFVISVAKALGETPEDLLRLTGHLDPPPPVTDTVKAVCQVLPTLSQRQQAAIAEIVFALAAKPLSVPVEERERPRARAPEETFAALQRVIQDHVLDIANVVLAVADAPARQRISEMVDARREKLRQEAERKPHLAHE